MNWILRVLVIVWAFGFVDAGNDAARADSLLNTSPPPNMSVAEKAECAAPRPGRISITTAGIGLTALGPRLAQNDVAEWCSQDKYCTTGSFCCGSGCCRDGTNCCARDGGCCPGNLPIGCGPKCYANQADAEADGCGNWEVCGAPAR